MWGKPVVMVAVRLSRYTHEKLDACKEFTICIPKDGELTKELAFAGVKSGRAFDKAAELNFRYLPAEKTAVPLLDRCSAAVSYTHLLYVLNWGEYLDPDLIKEFETLNPDIKINYTTTT